MGTPPFSLLPPPSPSPAHARARPSQYLSIMRWAFLGLAVNEFEGATFSCNDVDVAAGDSCTRTGEEVRKTQGGAAAQTGAWVGGRCMIRFGEGGRRRGGSRPEVGMQCHLAPDREPCRVPAAGAAPCAPQVLRSLSFDGSTTADAMLGLLALTVGFNLLAYVVLRVNKRRYQTFAK